MTLAEFALYLSKRGMVDITGIKDDTDDGFKNSLKIQKYAYFAKFYGLDLGYVYSIHLHGPYSRALTADYCALDTADAGDASVPPGLREDEFLSLVGDKNSDWLEIAATIIHEKNLNPEISLEHLYMMKCDHDPNLIDSVYHSLTDRGLLQNLSVC